LGYFTFNNSTCTWDNDGTVKPTEQQQKELLGYLLSTISLVLGIMMEPHNLQHQKKQTVGILFTFNNSTCTWTMMEPHNLQHQKK
jgi:hypothetical protein